MEYTNQNPTICPLGHKCYFTRQSYIDSDGKDITEFRCKKCGMKGKCKGGAYVCTVCKYVSHEKCVKLKKK